MATVWTIAQLERNPDNGVTQVHYHVSDSETIGETAPFGRSYGTTNFTPDASKDGYLSFDSLRQDVVIAWVKENLGDETVAAIEASIASQIAESKAPSILFGYPEGWDS